MSKLSGKNKFIGLLVIGMLALVAMVAGSMRIQADVPADIVMGNSVGKVATTVLDDTENGQSTSFIILLAEQADLSSAYTMKDQDARGWFVYDTLKSHAERTQAPLRAFLAERGVTYQAFWAANMIVVTGDRSLVEAVADRADVRVIESNKESRWIEEEQIANNTDAPVSPLAPEWGVTRVNAPAVWALGFTGQGMIIANQDTGMRWSHNGIKNQYRGWNGSVADHNYNWWDAIHSGGGVCGADSQVPCDDQGHGTHTTGTTVGDDGAGNQVGVAPGAEWIGCRNMNVGNGTPATYTECFEFFLAPTDLAGNNPNPALRPHVMNNSWGCPASEGCAANSLLAIIDASVASGIFVEFSAGNAGPGCSTVNTPGAIYASSYSTGAIDINNALASFSSRGPVTLDGSNRMKPEISAPGVNVRSTTPNSDSSYGSSSGTSMAGPHVAGVVALLWSAEPSLSRQITETKELLNETANPQVTVSNGSSCGGTPIPNNHFGYGRIDALAAVNAAGGGGTATVTVPVPTGTSTGTSTGTTVPATSTGTGIVPTGTPTIFPPTISPTGTGIVPSATATCVAGGVQLIQDGSFEGGTPNSFWTEESTNFGTPLCDAACGDGGGTAAPRTGTWWAWFGGIDAVENAAVEQTVNIPAGTATLQFYLWLGAHSGGGTSDYLRVLVGGTEVFRATDADTQYDAGYTLVTVDVSAQAGGSRVVRFESENGAATINFSVDDVSLTAGGGGCPTPGTTTATTTSVVTNTSTAAVTETATSTTGTGTAVATGTTGTVTAQPTATACTLTFTDVEEGSTFYSDIRCLACRGIINGYTTGCETGNPCFRPGNLVTRGQLAKIVANAAGFNEPTTGQQYEDVPEGSTFYEFVWRLTDRGLVNGYPCGGTGEPCGDPELPYYRPNANVTRGQLSKIVANGAGLTEPVTGQQYEDVEIGSTFYEYIGRLSALGVINGYPCGGTGEPCGDPELPYFRPGNNATRGQASKIVANTFFPGCETPSANKNVRK